MDGLQISQEADTDHDINVTAGTARSADGASSMALASEQTKRIDELEREIAKLRSRVEGLENTQPLPDPLDEKPPHY